MDLDNLFPAIPVWEVGFVHDTEISIKYINVNFFFLWINKYYTRTGNFWGFNEWNNLGSYPFFTEVLEMKYYLQGFAIWKW